MEAKLAEFRQRKLLEQRKAKSPKQTLSELFSWMKPGQNFDKNQLKQEQETSEIERDPAFLEKNEDETDEDEILQNAVYGKLDWILLVLKILLWFVVWKIFIELQFGAVYFALSALFFVYFNTRSGKRKKSVLSAYSVFNPNCERLQGTITAEQLESELLYRKPPS